MGCKSRPFIATALGAGIALGLSIAASPANAEARQVGGNKATWDKACKADKNCMPIGDLGDGVNGYFVHDGNGGGTPVWCDDNNCAAGRDVKPTKDAVQILQQPSGQLGSATGAKQLSGNESPAALLKLR